MTDIFFIIVSVASIVILPAIYLYMKRVAKKNLLAAQKDILMMLAFKLGKGQSLTLFEVQSVIDESLLKNRLKLGAIKPNEVIEDLVRECNLSPPIRSGRERRNRKVASWASIAGQIIWRSYRWGGKEIFKNLLSSLYSSKSALVSGNQGK
jgi:TATA-binding protein-associated factor Taf7